MLCVAEWINFLSKWKYLQNDHWITIWKGFSSWGWFLFLLWKPFQALLKTPLSAVSSYLFQRDTFPNRAWNFTWCIPLYLSTFLPFSGSQLSGQHRRSFLLKQTIHLGWAGGATRFWITLDIPVSVIFGDSRCWWHLCWLFLSESTLWFSDSQGNNFKQVSKILQHLKHKIHFFLCRQSTSVSN